MQDHTTEVQPNTRNVGGRAPVPWRTVVEPTEHPYRQVLYIAGAAASTLPGVVLAATGFHPEQPGARVLGAVLFGIAIVGAAFLVAWAAEVIQLDISAGLALALLAFIAVLPEYAVDFVFTWKAGQDPDRYASLALANMTGANQLLIGLGWPLVVFVGTWKIRKLLGRDGRTPGGSTAHKIALDPTQAIDISFLTLASLYAVTLPFRSSLTLFDAAVLVTIYVAYVFRLARAPAEEPHLIGPPALIGSLPTAKRRVVNLIMFAAAATVILLVAEPFADALVGIGETFGISEFLLVKWLAPLASEAPELLVAMLFAWKLSPEIGLGALVSSKVNQWTLLVGTLPIVFAISSSSFNGLPLGIQQRDELLVTAAQSIFAIAVLASLTMGRTEASVMLALFVAQLASSGILPERYAAPGRIAVGVIFLLAAAWVLRGRFQGLRAVVSSGLRKPYEELARDRG